MKSKAAKRFGIKFIDRRNTVKQYPLDAYDYELANSADDNEETFTFDEVLKECGLTYDDIQRNKGGGYKKKKLRHIKKAVRL